MIAPTWLDAGDSSAITDRLRALGWLAPNDVPTSITTAGTGNLNLVLRVEADGRSVIFKQARPWVERYPSIAAPVERSAVEAGFYRLVHATPALHGFMPQLIGIDPTWHILLIEDAGVQADTILQYARALTDAPIRARLIDFLVKLHGLRAPQPLVPCNRAMMTINHAHIFLLPFAETDSDLAIAASRLGDRYLTNAGALLHGDFFPEAWVYGANGVQVIDPEFCLFGPPEFDLGVMAAHLMIAGSAASTPDQLIEQYHALGGDRVERALVARYAGVEIWRRLLGVARVAFPISDDRRTSLMALAAALIRQ